MVEPTKSTPSSKPGAREEDIAERRSIRDYYIIVRERFWVAMPLALIVAIGLAYYQSREVPMYNSVASIQIEKPEKIMTGPEVVDMSVNSDIELNTYLQIIRSAKLRTKVVDSFTPEETKILQRAYVADLPPGVPLPPPAAVLGVVDVQTVRNSFLVNIAVQHRDPEAAALVANRYVEQFMLYMLESKGGKNEFAVEYLENAAKKLREDSVAAEEKLLEYMKRQKLVSLDNSSNIVTTRLNAVNAALQQARLERLDIEEQVNQVDLFRQDDRNLLEISYISNHGTIPNLREKLAELVRDESLLTERYLEKHPKMIDLENARQVAQAQLDRAIELAIADLRAIYEKAKNNETTLQREYAEHEKEQVRLRDLGVEYNNLQNAAEVAKSNYTQILDRLSQTTTSSNLENIPIRPLDRAYASGSPFTPNISRITRTAITVGILVFFGTALGLSFVDDRVKSSWDIESFIGVNLLGIVPDLSSLKDEQRYALFLGDQDLPGSEAFLSVYSSVKINSKLDFPKSILVTSTIPGEGKTLVSTNLAGSFARHGRKTLLVDCDLRRPMLHRHFKLENTNGIIPWAEKGAVVGDNPTADLDLGIVRVSENFDLLRSGGRSRTPTELLESPPFGQLLEKLKKHYELVVIDSPPMGAVTDSLLIAEHSDEVIYVCRFNRAFRKHIRLYIKALRGGKNEILGVVLNGLSQRRIEYYSHYRYYRSYKKYYGTQG